MEATIIETGRKPIRKESKPTDSISQLQVGKPFFPNKAYRSLENQKMEGIWPSQETTIKQQ